MMFYSGIAGRLILLCTFTFFWSGVAFSQAEIHEGTTIYIVRHAEKEAGQDPGLSEAGKLRSGDLYRELKNTSIQKILVTQFRRTQMTADSLRLLAGIDTVHYQADETGEGLKKKLSGIVGNVLIIGHSNTIPAILNRLGLKEKQEMDETYHTLFILRNKNGEIILTRKSYGKIN